MEPNQIVALLQERFPEDILGETAFHGQTSVTVSKDAIQVICRYLHDEPSLDFKLLRDLTAVDYMGKQEPRFEVIYHIYSINHRHFLRLKAPVTERDCKIATVTPIWIGADWHERECFDLFGIEFTGHPDLRRVLLPEDWQGFPLRKDYPTEGFKGEQEWEGYKEVLEKSKRLKVHEWNR